MKKIYICGDSTAASYDPAETLFTGWGQLLGDHLPGVTVINRAFPGRSTKSFLAEGRLAAIEKELTAGDILLVQFAHNDESEKPARHTEPRTEYRRNLNVFIDTARRAGAIPVLVTPVCMRVWENGTLQPTHGEYLTAMRETAAEQGVPLMEMYEESFRIVREAGEEQSGRLFMNLSPGEHPQFPEGRTDNAHTRYAGAEPLARYAAEWLTGFMKMNE